MSAGKSNFDWLICMNDLIGRFFKHSFEVNKRICERSVFSKFDWSMI